MDDERDDCTICGGEGFVECNDPIQCLDPHEIDNATDRCRACGGSGRAEDQTVW